MNKNAHDADAIRPFSVAKNEKPFVSELAWAYFFAYHVIVQNAYTIAQMIESGTEVYRRLA